MARNNKYIYYKVLQGWLPGTGWEDICKYNTKNKEQMSKMETDLASHKKEGERVRVVDKRELACPHAV